jgi:hypothetical protein
LAVGRLGLRRKPARIWRVSIKEARAQ